MEFRNYSLQIGNKLLIQNLNITFEPNVINHLLGSNGSGKSSLAKSCVGIYKYEGQIIGNKNIVLIGSSSNVPSSYNLINLVNILTKRFEKQKVMELYDLLKLGEINHSLSIKKMSDGQKQKVKLLSFLSANPKVIILDEFTTALDKSSALDVYGFMLRYSKSSDITIINITHNLSDVEYLPGKYYYLTNLKIEQIETKKDIINAYMKGDIVNGNKA